MRNKIDIQNAIALLSEEGYTITEPSIVADRIEVANIIMLAKQLEDRWQYSFITTDWLNPNKFPAIKKAIESVINDTVVEDELAVLRIFREEFKNRELYTKSEVDAMMEDNGLHYFREGYKYLRATNTEIVPYDELAEMTVVGAFKNFRRKEATLPLQQVQEDKPDSMRVGEDMICPVTKQHCDDECCPVGAVCNLSSNDIKEPELEAKDKPFVWDDKLVIEYSQQWARDRKIPSLAIELFKQSKQSPTNLQWWEKLGIKFDGKWYTHPKANTYDNLDQVIVELNQWVEPQNGEPQPSTTVKDNQNYKILTFEGVYGQLLHLDKQNFKYRSETSSISDIDFLMKYYKIKSVQRLSDNCVFSVGEFVNTNRSRGKHKIDGFKIIDGNMCVVMSTFPTINEFLYSIDKVTDTPLPAEELMYNSFSIDRIHPKNDLCDALGCVKYDERIHK